MNCKTLLLIFLLYDNLTESLSYCLFFEFLFLYPILYVMRNTPYMQCRIWYLGKTAEKRVEKIGGGDRLLDSWISDETHCRVFEIASQISDNFWRRQVRKFCYSKFPISKPSSRKWFCDPRVQSFSGKAEKMNQLKSWVLILSEILLRKSPL